MGWGHYEMGMLWGWGQCGNGDTVGMGHKGILGMMGTPWG